MIGWNQPSNAAWVLGSVRQLPRFSSRIPSLKLTASSPLKKLAETQPKIKVYTFPLPPFFRGAAVSFTGGCKHLGETLRCGPRFEGEVWSLSLCPGFPALKPGVFFLIFYNKQVLWPKYCKFIKIRLMEEIPNNHLGCKKQLVNNGINYQPQQVFSPGFLNHQSTSGSTSSFQQIPLPRTMAEAGSSLPVGILNCWWFEGWNHLGVRFLVGVRQVISRRVVFDLFFFVQKMGADGGSL